MAKATNVQIKEVLKHLEQLIGKTTCPVCGASTISTDKKA